jgi:hypothetical protein
MNGSTSIDFGERGARDGIHEYCQDLEVSASEELTKVPGSMVSTHSEVSISHTRSEESIVF